MSIDMGIPQVRLATGTAYDTMMASLSPSAWWKLTEPSGSTTAADSSGSGHLATVNGSVTFGESTTPIPGNTTCLINGGSYGNNGLLSNLTIPSGTTAFTANIWLFIPTWAAATYYPIPFASATASTSNYGFYLLGKLSSTAGQTSVQYVIGNGTTTIGPYAYPSTSAWHMFTLAYSSSGVQGFLDGTSLGAAQAVTANWNTGFVTLGYAGGGAGDYVSEIAEPAVWIGTTLTSTQISSLFASA